MIKDLHISEAPKQPISMNAKKFALWLFMVTIVMLFAAFTSAYIVRQSEGNWLNFELPSIFYFSTAVLILSSATMHWAYISAKKDNLSMVKLATGITLTLGLVFLFTQYSGWGNLVDQGVYLVGNPSGSFLYIITGLHGLHIISGLVFLLILLLATIKYKVHSKKMLLIEMGATYWHFLDILWVYLLIFLILNR